MTVLSLALAGPALASGKPALVPGHVHTAGRPSPFAATSHAAKSAAANDSATTATLTETPSSVPNGANFTFTYTVPASEVNSENWIGMYEPGQTPGVEDSTCWNWSPDASGTLTFSSTCLDGVGPYVAWLFYDNGYSVLAGPVDVTVSPSKPAHAPQFAGTIGQHGPGSLTKPYGVAVAPDHSVWVADRGTSLVEQFSPSGHYLRSIGAGDLRDPHGVAVDSAGNVWVADTGQGEIVGLALGQGGCSCSDRRARR